MLVSRHMISYSQFLLLPVLLTNAVFPILCINLRLRCAHSIQFPCLIIYKGVMVFLFFCFLNFNTLWAWWHRGEGCNGMFRDFFEKCKLSRMDLDQKWDLEAIRTSSIGNAEAKFSSCLHGLFQNFVIVQCFDK